MKSLAFIWDLDGTLLDSYGIIVNSLYQIYKEKGIEIDKQEILYDVINGSVSIFIKKMEQQYGVPFEDLKDRYSIISGAEKLNIKAMEHSIEILKYLKDNHIPNYVFTHRGKTTETVLRNVKLFSYFDDIVTSLDGFERRPSPDGINYLVKKHNLDKNKTFYVGDRPMDIMCASNANVKSIMYIPKNSVAHPTGKETHIIKDLLDIVDIVEKEVSAN